MKFLFTIIWLLTVSTLAAAKTHPFQAVAGEHYRMLEQPIPDTSGTVIFLWYGCNSCYQLEKLYAQQHPLWQRIPISIYRSWRPQTKLFYTLRSLKLGLDIDQQLMAALSSGNLSINHVKLQQNFVSALATTEIDIETVYFSSNVNQQAAYSDTLQRQINITKVPAALVDGKYFLALSMVSGLQQFVDVLDYLEQLTATKSQQAADTAL